MLLLPVSCMTGPSETTLIGDHHPSLRPLVSGFGCGNIAVHILMHVEPCAWSDHGQVRRTGACWRLPCQMRYENNTAGNMITITIRDMM